MLYGGLLVLAFAVFMLAVQAKRSQYPDSPNGNPHLSQSAKMDQRACRGLDLSHAAIAATAPLPVTLIPEGRPTPLRTVPRQRASALPPFRFRPPPAA
jgi:hypothetical protein